MRAPVLALLLCAPVWPPVATPAAAADGPATPIGQFGDWTAATHPEGGQTVCFAFTRSSNTGAGQAAVLSVAHRPLERDDVAIAAAVNYRHASAATLTIAGRAFAFYTAEENAFAEDGAAVAAALRTADIALARATETGGASAVDQFSLKGFADAYAAISRTCPGT